MNIYIYIHMGNSWDMKQTKTKNISLHIPCF